MLSDKPLFFAVSSYTATFRYAVMNTMLKTTLIPPLWRKTSCDEIGLPVSATGGVPLRRDGDLGKINLSSHRIARQLPYRGPLAKR